MNYTLVKASSYNSSVVRCYSNRKYEINYLASQFKVGQDVEWAKKCVGEKLDCNRNEFDLYFEGKVMPEFYSLNDVANLQDGSKVDVKMKN